MRRSSLASAPFKPPRRVSNTGNTSVSSVVTEAEANNEAEDFQTDERRSKRIKLSDGQNEPEDVLTFHTDVEDPEPAPVCAEALLEIDDIHDIPVGSEREIVSTAVKRDAPSPTYSTASTVCVKSSRSPSPSSSPKPVTPALQASASNASESFSRPRGAPQASRHSFSIAQRKEPETVEALTAQKIQLEDRIKELEDQGNKVEDLHEYMDLLHKYNSAKDIAQFLMGQLAIRDGITVRHVAENIGAPAEEG